MATTDEHPERSGSRICSRCGHDLTQVGAFWICPEHGPQSEPKPFAPLHIFLSYGHDTNEELVLLIRDDLAKRGHDVWFDKTKIKSGHDWRRSITEGIVGSDRVLSFLSKHSTRNPGVCLDEIGIAIGVMGGNIETILVESEDEVQPPPSVSHIQWLDMHDWKEKRQAGEAAWERWYQAKLDQIIEALEHGRAYTICGGTTRCAVEVADRWLHAITQRGLLPSGEVRQRGSGLAARA